MCNCHNLYGGIVFPSFVAQSCCNPCCSGGSVGGASDSTDNCDLCRCLKKLCRCLDGSVGGTSDYNTGNCCKPCNCGAVGGVSSGHCGCHR